MRLPPPVNATRSTHGSRLRSTKSANQVEAAQLNAFEKGELFRFGMREGLLSTRHMTRASTHPSRKYGRNQVYTRTRKQVRALAAVKT